MPRQPPAYILFLPAVAGSGLVIGSVIATSRRDRLAAAPFLPCCA
ncbi:hypothetical protein [Rhizobium alarense]|nr:hypothetical protein [Rhizobium alarense]